MSTVASGAVIHIANGAMLSFDTPAMARSFNLALDAGQAEAFWKAPMIQTEPWDYVLDVLKGWRPDER